MSNICRFTVPASRDIESIIDYIAENRGYMQQKAIYKRLIKNTLL